LWNKFQNLACFPHLHISEATEKLGFSVGAFTAFSGICLIIIYELGEFDIVQVLIL
jgi:hypothetical protein